MVASAYKWSTQERTWLADNGVKDDTYIGRKLALPKVRRTK